MTSKELVMTTLQGKAVPRFPTGPLAVHYCAQLAGYTLRQYSTNPKALAESVLVYYEKFRPDAVWVSADTWVTAEAMGARVRAAADDQPIGGSGVPVVKNLRDVEAIPVLDIRNQGRFQVLLEALARVVEQIGEDVFVVGCFDQSPFSLACALMGMDNAMLALMDDPDLLLALMQRAEEYCVPYALAMADAGAHMLSTGDSPAGLIGRELYQQFALPAEQRVFSGIKKKSNVFLSLHICGDATPILADMAASGADVLEVDSLVEMEKACELVPDNIALWGNLDPVGLLQNGTPEEVASQVRGLADVAKKHNRSRLVVSSGCTLALDTPEENIASLCEALK